MKVKYKALVVALFSVLFLIAVTWITSYLAYFGYVNRQNYRDIRRSFEIIDYTINNEKINLRNTLYDWAQWDATYKFIEDSNQGYIDSNLEGDSLSNINLKMMIFFNNKGDVVYHKYQSLDDGTASLLFTNLSHSEKITGKLASKADIESFSGLVAINDRVFMVDATPVTSSTDEVKSNGTLMIVREIDENLLSYISDITKVTLTFNSREQDHSEVLKGSTLLDEDTRIQDNKEYLKATRILKDINNDKSIVFSVTKEKDNYQKTIFYFRMYILLFVCMVAIIITLDIFIINKYILKRLSTLHRFMNTVAATKDPTLSLEMSGRDEFFELSRSTNKMLSELDSAYKDIKNMNERFRIIMEATNDGYVDFYAKTQEVYISPEWKQLIGYEGEDGVELFNNYISKIHPECVKRLRNKYFAVLEGQIEYFIDEYRVLKADGSIIWVQQRGKIAEKDDTGKPIRIVSTLSNITDRKRNEEEILFLSYSDKLTGLKNRAFMEKQFECLDKNKASRYYIIMGDLNGLKLANDSLGHVEGDRLLVTISNILKKTCANDDIIARWGGDEFVILVKDKEKLYISGLINSIKAACDNISDFKFKVSIALGYAKKSDEGSVTEFVMNLAEKRMYRNKLMENDSSRNAIISSLTRTLHEKHSETEEHTIRIKILSLKLGNRLGLDQDKLDELALLGLLHDIGKIGIPEQILMKPSMLTEEERTIMKTHTEIGYRIAKSTLELSHIAESILYHHEKYDGTGYPRGLKGEEIPVLSRIVNIVDSFDVMTNKRIYKDSFSIKYAVGELIKCSGKQFDPYIVEEFIKLLKDEKIFEE